MAAFLQAQPGEFGPRKLEELGRQPHLADVKADMWLVNEELMKALRELCKPLLLALPFALAAGAAYANDVEGEVEAIDAEARSLTVQGI